MNHKEPKRDKEKVTRVGLGVYDMKHTRQDEHTEQYRAMEVFSRLGAAMEDVLKAAPQLLSEKNKFRGPETHGPCKRKVA